MGMKHSARTTLDIESLEDRCVPAVAFRVVDSTLFLSGDGAANSIVITDNGTNLPNNVTVVADGQLLTFPNINISIFRVATGKGRDFVSYTMTNGMQSNRKVVVDLGEGRDVFLAHLPRRSEPDKTMSMEINGGDGNDLLDVNARGFDILDTGRFLLTQLGGDGDDTISFRYKARITGELVYNAFGGDDDDRIFADIVAFDRTDTGPSAGRVIANVFGEDEDDAITLWLHRTGASTTLLIGFADGGDDDNTLIRTANVAFTRFKRVTTIVR